MLTDQEKRQLRLLEDIAFLATPKQVAKLLEEIVPDCDDCPVRKYCENTHFADFSCEDAALKYILRGE